LPVSEGLAADAALLFETVREAGALALTMLRQNVRRWTKPDGSPVTEADVAVDTLLRGRLDAKRPAYGWLSEETPDDESRLARSSLWIADPIDGTRDFIAGGSEWCIAVALIRDGRPAAAAIYRPVSEDFFSAIAGAGAFLNGDPIAATQGDALAGARVLGTLKSLAPLAEHAIETVTPGSLPLQLRLAFVAHGQIDAAVSAGRKNDWDLAAGDLIVAEAGGLTSDFAGRPFVYNRRESWQQGLAAAGARRHPQLIDALRSP
jgi:myo-inositol-1(or 4)-monophosphatase